YTSTTVDDRKYSPVEQAADVRNANITTQATDTNAFLPRQKTRAFNACPAGEAAPSVPGNESNRLSRTGLIPGCIYKICRTHRITREQEAANTRTRQKDRQAFSGASRLVNVSSFAAFRPVKRFPCVFRQKVHAPVIAQ
ncbi:hypothetical protein TNCV_3668731, partial [Trichonephila clavipes]